METLILTESEFNNTSAVEYAEYLVLIVKMVCIKGLYMVRCFKHNVKCTNRHNRQIMEKISYLVRTLQRHQAKALS